MEIYIEGQPLAKKRPKFSRYRCYDPQDKEKKNYRLLLEKKIHEAANGDQKDDVLQIAELAESSAFHVDLTFGMQAPQSWSQKRLKSAYEQNTHHTTKPDIDNLIKFVMDCSNGIFFTDDRQVVSISANKIYAQSPYTRLKIIALNGK